MQFSMADLQQTGPQPTKHVAGQHLPSANHPHLAPPVDGRHLVWHPHDAAMLNAPEPARNA